MMWVMLLSDMVNFYCDIMNNLVKFFILAMFVVYIFGHFMV